MTSIQYFLIITMAYILCHGITALVVTPVQEIFLTDITVFASLVYLPHGVRILATWLWGWKAIFPLYLGSFLSDLIFTPVHIQGMFQEDLHYSIGVGAASSLLVFEAMRLIGRDVYARKNREMDWKCLLFVGAVASVVNSIGQTIVYSGLILPDHALYVFVTYAVGDLIGLLASMLGLMMIFRWIRLTAQTS